MTYDKDSIVFEPIPSNPRFIDLTGSCFGRFLVTGYAGKLRNGRPTWWCKCECDTIKAIGGRHLKSGKIQSCGCYRSECSTKRNTTHGASHTAENAIYRTAKARCTNKNTKCYPRYGGRGIEFRFDSFEQFYAEIGKRPTPRHTLDRKNNNGHYEVGNIHWATPTEQGRNKRNNRFFTINGISKTAPEWVETFTLNNVDAIFARRDNGWCDECAITIPVHGGHCSHLNL